MRVCVLGSGSRGNAIYVDTPTVRLVVDAGLNAKEMRARLAEAGLPQDRLDAILVTHEHHDHVQCVSPVARAFGATVWLTEATHAVARHRLKATDKFRVFEAGAPVAFGDLVAEPVRKPHDAADPVAFLFHNEGATLGCFTDLGSVDEAVGLAIARCAALVMESNHDPALLAAGPYPQALKGRIGSELGHLSNDQSAKAIAKWASPMLRTLVLAHLSETNNTPDHVRRAYLTHMGPRASVDRWISYQSRATRVFDVAPLAAAQAV